MSRRLGLPLALLALLCGTPRVQAAGGPQGLEIALVLLAVVGVGFLGVVLVAVAVASHRAESWSLYLAAVLCGFVAGVGTTALLLGCVYGPGRYLGFLGPVFLLVLVAPFVGGIWAAIAVARWVARQGAAR